MKDPWRLLEPVLFCLSLLKILSQEKLEQLRKSRATSRDESMRVAGSTISGCRVIQI
jgi:hypothetical protein